MYSTRNGAIKTARMLCSSSSLARTLLVRNGITWPVFSRGYHEDPQYPSSLYHPAFSMGFKIDSSEAIPLNELRAKYAFNSPAKTAGLPWSHLRAFKSYPLKHLEFCKTTLAQVASEHREFPVEIGQPFCAHDRDLSFVFFHVSSPGLQEVYTKLIQAFEHIRKEMIRTNARKLRWDNPHSRFNQHYSLRKKFTPKIYICKAPSDKADAILNDLKEQRSRGAWTAKAIALKIFRDTRVEYYRSPEYVDRYIEFPFRKSKNSGD